MLPGSEIIENIGRNSVNIISKRSEGLKYHGFVLILAIHVMSIPVAATDTASEREHQVDTLALQAVRLSGFSLTEAALQAAVERVQSITVHLHGRGKSTDTTIYHAWQLTFRDVPLQWKDGQTYVRDYAVLVDKKTAGLLLIMSPAVSDTVYFDGRESTSSGHPQFDAHSTLSANGVQISFADALTMCDFTNPLKAETLEAAVISYGDEIIRSAIAWDIVAHGVTNVDSRLVGGYPRGNLSESEKKTIAERHASRKYDYVRQFIDAGTGKSLGGEVNASYDDD